MAIQAQVCRMAVGRDGRSQQRSRQAVEESASGWAGRPGVSQLSPCRQGAARYKGLLARRVHGGDLRRILQR